MPILADYLYKVYMNTQTFDVRKRWIDLANKTLVGKTIAEVRYLTDEEMKGMAWYCNPPVIIFTDGSYILPMRDDEGNDGGAMCGASASGEEYVLPVI